MTARSLAVDDDLRAEIDACQDIEVLNRWLRQAATANTAADVIEPGAA